MSTFPPPPRQVFDIAVVGAGAVGLAFAAAMKQAMGRRASVAVVDPRPRARDGHIRTVALSEGSRRLLERIGFGAGLAKHAATALGATALVTVIAATRAATEQTAHTGAAGVTLGFHDLLDERLDRAPVGVVGKTEFVLDALLHLLHHLGRIKIPTLTLAAIAAAVTTIATAVTATAAIVGLGHHAARRHQGQRSHQAAHRPFQGFHFHSVLCFVLVWFKCGLKN